MIKETIEFPSLEEVAKHIREKLSKNTKSTPLLLFAHNGVGKTRLSMIFRKLGKEGGERDTLYFNAFTQDLFSWDNDLENDNRRVLSINQDSRFVTALRELEMESRIREFLPRYADFTFEIDYEKWQVIFGRELTENGKSENIDYIKVSRSEENIFIWCFFLAIAKLAIDKVESYSWVKYLFIDDPISSLDDNYAIEVAVHLMQVLKNAQSTIKAVISTHHGLFFNVVHNEAKNKNSHFMSKLTPHDSFQIQDMSDTPNFQHTALLLELARVSASGKIYTYHFNILRNILEKTAAFHGYQKFSDCIQQGENDLDGSIHERFVNLFSHGKYSLFDPVKITEENKHYFREVLSNLIKNFNYNPELLSIEDLQNQTS